MSPRETRPCTASRTDVRATANSSLMARSAGNWSPGRNTPVRMDCSRASRIPSEMVRLATGSNRGLTSVTPTASALRHVGEAPLPGVQVEGTDDGLVLLGPPVVGRDQPHDLELEPVGVLGVDALVGPVVAGPDQ